METKVKNREWVKDAAIIFLAVLLVLTFFSNTIMNRTLPEVATASVHEGAIVAKVRGTGVVTATGKHQVKAKETRTIRAVMVKVGQEVNAGDVLFVLGEGDETEMEQAMERLRTLRSSYERTAVSAPVFDYSSYNRAIETAQNNLERAQREYQEEWERSSSPVAEAAKARYEAAKEKADQMEEDYAYHRQEKIDELKYLIQELSAQIGQMEEAAAATLKPYEDALAAAQSAYEAEAQNFALIESDYLNAKEEYDFILRQVDDVPQEVFNEKYNAYETAKASYNAERPVLDQAQQDVENAELDLEQARATALGPEYDILQAQLSAAYEELASWENESIHYEEVRKAIEERDRLYEEYISVAGSGLENAEYALQDALIALDAARLS